MLEVQHHMMLTIRLSGFSCALCARFVAPGRLEVPLYFGIAIPDGSSRYYFFSNSKGKEADETFTSKHKHDFNMVARKYDLDVYLALVHVIVYNCHSPSLICFTHDLT